jgi:prepilin-type N-terminal cleavage/methylation domain-containing protein
MSNAALSPATRCARQSGFTLVEVIVVLSVVLLLTGIAVPMLSSYMEDGRRARAEDECKVLGAAVMSFYKDTGVYPARSSAGTNNYVYSMFTGSTMPSTNPFNAGHNWITWAMNATRGDLLDNHLLQNQPQNTTGAAYPTTGSNRWRGPYVAGNTPLDPWGRPYVVNVISGYYSHATNYKRLWVVSAGTNGRFDTDYLATATTNLAGDDIGVLLGQQQ